MTMMRHSELDGSGRKSHYELENDLARGSLSPTDNWPGNGLAGFETTYGDGTVKDLTWCVRRHVATAQEVWAVTWVEKRMLFNPVQVRECVLQEGTTTLDLSVAWVNQKRYGNLGTLVSERNTNGFIASGIPAGYELLVWTCQIGRNDGSVLSRGRHWRPCSRMAAIAKTDYRIFSGDYMKTSRLYGVGLYNPTTGARSVVKVAGYRGTLAGGGPGFRVLK